MARPRPLVSIVTPCLNQARFLREAIESVLAQSYPNIEYIVMDGGSADGSADILRSYGERLRWFSQQDRGQAEAINRGFQESSGEVFAFLNADDRLLPGAVESAVRALEGAPGAGGVCGLAWQADEDGRILGSFPTGACDLATLSHRCSVCQPSVFLRSEVFREAGMLDPRLHFALDYDLWIRVARRWTMAPVNEYLAIERVHSGAKTHARRREALTEAMAVLRRHFGYVPFQWVYDYASLLVGQPYRFGEAYPRSVTAWGLSVALGTLVNWRRVDRYWRECGAPVVRRLRSVTTI